MEIQPALKAERFEKLEAGDLFLFPFENGSNFALKAMLPLPDNDAFIVPLGPNFPTDDLQPRLLDWQAETTVSFGRSAIFELATEPETWSVVEPSREVPCCVLAGAHVYLRANAALYPGRFEACWILVTSGLISRNRPSGVSAYVTQWRILFSQGTCPPRCLLQHRQLAT